MEGVYLFGNLSFDEQFLDLGGYPRKVWKSRSSILWMLHQDFFLMLKRSTACTCFQLFLL